ncbi:MAG: ABC transporter ATP-binding protein [Clostridia bacterium]|nr:ABC transporter ATP-binding protein [Clostridia bacterium]
MIKAESITFSYGENKIFQSLSTAFEKGKFCCIIGKNGSGKSTLLKLLSGYIKPEQGVISVDDKAASSYSRREYAQKTAILAQEREKADFTVYDYVSSGRYPYLGITRRLTATDRQLISEAISKTNLESKIHENISNLSGGERQRVYIASVLAQNTPYILLDEPTTYLDVSAKFEVMNYLSDMAKNGKGVIAVMHDISLALKYADSLLILDKENGIYTACTPTEAYENGSIEKAFGVKCKAISTDNKTEFIITDQ